MLLFVIICVTTSIAQYIQSACKIFHKNSQLLRKITKYLEEIIFLINAMYYYYYVIFLLLCFSYCIVHDMKGIHCVIITTSNKFCTNKLGAVHLRDLW